MDVGGRFYALTVASNVATPRWPRDRAGQCRKAARTRQNAGVFRHDAASQRLDLTASSTNQQPLGLVEQFVAGARRELLDQRAPPA